MNSLNLQQNILTGCKTKPKISQLFCPITNVI